MLTANKKDQIINARGESSRDCVSSKAYNVVLTDRQCTVVSMDGSDRESVILCCKQRFGDNFVRVD